MGCTSSKGINPHGSSAYNQQYQPRPGQMPPPPPYSLNPDNVPPSTLPEGWISQFDPEKQRLYYVYPQTRHVTWAHPNGQAADAQEMARFYQIQELQSRQYGHQFGPGHQQQQYYGNGNVSKPFADSYNRMGGMGTGAALAMGVFAGGAAGLLAGSLLADGLSHSHYGGYDGYYGDTTPAIHEGYGTDIGASYGGDFSADFSGGGDFGGGDFGF